MPKEIGNGKSTMQALTMELTAISMRFSNHITELVILADKAIEADQQDDPLQAECLNLIKQARNEENADVRKAYLDNAIHALEQAITMDFEDESIRKFKNAILPAIKASDAVKVEALELQAKLQRAGK